jgi:hypothetical protein
MKAFSKAITTAAQSLEDWLADQTNTNLCDSVTIQNPAGNNIMYLGSDGNQPLELAAGDSISLPITRLDQTYVRGTNAELLTILIFP